jgi:hypothetical protein
MRPERLIRNVLACLLATFVFVICSVGLYRELRLEIRGQVMLAEVIELREIQRGFFERFKTSYEVRYRFRPNEAQAVEPGRIPGPGEPSHFVQVMSDDWERAERDGVIRVVYDPENPGIHRPQKQNPLYGRWVTGLIWLIAGFLALFYGRKAYLALRVVNSMQQRA